MEFDATFIFAAVSFIVFVFIMNKIFYAPVLKIMKERQIYVEKNYISAKQTEEETKKQREYRDSELEKSRESARSLINENSQRLKSEHSKKINQYKTEQNEHIFVERENLKNSALSAKEVLKDNIVDIAKEISLKILGSDIDAQKIDKSQIREQG